MSVKRYQPVAQCVEPSYQAQMVEAKVMEFSEGEYVLHSDYARLKAEVERLTDSITRGAITPDAKKFEPAENETDYLTVYLYAAELAKDSMKKVKTENAFLKMEVERLKNNAAYLDTKLDEELDKNG